MVPSTQSYTNWYNQKTGNSGIIKVTKSYLEGSIKCKDYDATIDIYKSMRVNRYRWRE